MSKSSYEQLTSAQRQLVDTTLANIRREGIADWWREYLRDQLSKLVLATVTLTIEHEQSTS